MHPRRSFLVLIAVVIALLALGRLHAQQENDRPVARAMLEALPYAILSEKIYAHSATNPPPATVTLDINGKATTLRLFLRTSDPATGFCSEAYRSEGLVVIAFEGSTGKADLVNDVMIVNQLTPPQAILSGHIVAAILGTLDSEGKPRPRIVLTGHSLGGYLAHMQAQRYGLEAFTFNAPLINPPNAPLAFNDRIRLFHSIADWRGRQPAPIPKIAKAVHKDMRILMLEPGQPLMRDLVSLPWPDVRVEPDRRIPVPVDVSGLENDSWAAALALHSIVGLRASMELYIRKSGVQTPAAEPVATAAVAVKSTSVLYVEANSSAFLRVGNTWHAVGNNRYGQLATGDYTSRVRFVPVPGIAADIASVSASPTTVIALDPKGHAWGWGQAVWSTAATSTEATRPIRILGDATWRAVAVDNSGVYHLTDAGVLGFTGTYSAGLEQRRGTITLPITDVRDVVSCQRFHLALTTTGEVYEWGNLQPPSYETVAHPYTRFELPAKAVAIYGGVQHGFILLEDGSLMGLGMNWAGCLGDGSDRERYAPVRVTLPAGVKIRSVSHGVSTTVAVTDDGRVYSWGAIGGPTPRLLPLPGGTRAVTAWAGRSKKKQNQDYLVVQAEDGKFHGLGYGYELGLTQDGNWPVRELTELNLTTFKE